MAARQPIIKVQKQNSNPLPAYTTEGSAGMDLAASIDSPIEIKPLERKLITTGLFLELPAGYEAQVRPRSGLALNHGITVLNSPGTIDQDYRGEIQVLLINLSAETFNIQPGDRIAQLIISPYQQAIWEEVTCLSKTKRGVGGYGHTGRR